MKQSYVVILVAVTVAAVVGLIGLTLVLVPENTNPAFDVAERFINAAGLNDDDTAFPLLSDEMQAYVTDNCPDGSVSACVLGYTPNEWGTLIGDSAAVFRRSIPDGEAWDVLLVATYQEGQGFAGVCIYHRMERNDSDEWRVAGWSGFISCDEPNSGIQGLRRDDAPNRAP